jgi:hypothetical protein
MVFLFDLENFPCSLQTTRLLIHLYLGSSNLCRRTAVIIPNYFLILSLFFYSSYILHISHQSRRHQCLRRRLATADTPSSVVFHLLFSSFLSVTYIPPIIGDVFDSSPRPALPSYLLPFVFSPLYYSFHMCLTPITGGFSDDSLRPTLSPSLPPSVLPLSCYYITSNIRSHTLSILK